MKSSSSSSANQKPKKPEKNKSMPPVTKKGLKGETRGGADPGYTSGGSQGGQHSPLKGYGSPPTPLEGDHGAGGQWKQEDELTNILRHQTLSDPSDPTSPMAMAFSPHGGGGGVYTRPPDGGGVQMDQVTSHVTSSAHPNGKASRQRGGGLALPAGRTQGMTQTANTYHHHPTVGPHPQAPPPPPSYPQPLLYSPSRQASYHHFLMPSYLSYHSGYSTLPQESLPQAPSSAHYTQQQLPRGTHTHLPQPSLRERESALTNHNPPGTNLPTPSSSGYSSCGSPKGHHQKSPSDDSSVVGGASIHSNAMTNSYSTFSSTSSRVSSPSNGGVYKSNPCPGAGDPGLKNAYPLQQSLRMPGNAARGRHGGGDDAMSEASGRSWVYSSQSSRYSTYSATGSELSDDLLDRLPPADRRHGFAKVTPLPFPESMQDQFEVSKQNGTAPVTGMECSPPNGTGAALLGDTFPHPHSPVSMQLDFQGDATLPLFHLPRDSAGLFVPNDAHLPYYSHSQCTADSFEFQMNYSDTGASVPGVMFDEMAPSFTSNLPDDTQCLERLLNSQAN